MPYDKEGVGWQKTDTSYQAKPDNAKTVRSAVYRALIVPRTCDEVASFLAMDRLTVRPRITELRNANLVRDTGHRRQLRSGKKGIVWERAE